MVGMMARDRGSERVSYHRSFAAKVAGECLRDGRSLQASETSSQAPQATQARARVTDAMLAQ